MSIFSAIGGLIGGFMQNKAAKEQQRFQQEYAMKNIRWKVKDAKAAGIHPLAALGVQPAGGAPTAIPDYSDMGQNIGRAIDATMTGEQKNDDYTKAVQSLTLQRMETENNLLKLNLVNSASATVRQAGNPPAYFASAESGETPRRPELPMGSLGVIPQSRRWAPAQDVEDEYSDAVSNVYGVLKWIRDYNLATRPPRTNPLTKRYWQDRVRDYRNWRANNHVRYRSRREKGVDYGYW